MPLIRVRDMHVPKGHDLFFMCAGATTCFFWALLIYLGTWLAGGDDFAEQLGGNATLWVLIVGAVVFAIAALLTKPDSETRKSE